MNADKLARLQARSRVRNGAEAPAVKNNSVENVSTATEQHYLPAEIAKMWAISIWTVRRLFATAPGVLRIKGEKGNTSLVIPETVLRREYEKLTK
jgi:hypothetical protein